MDTVEDVQNELNRIKKTYNLMDTDQVQVALAFAVLLLIEKMDKIEKAIMA